MLHYPHKGIILTIRIGSLFTGVSGLELELLKDPKYSLSYVADPDKYCAAILAHNHPHTLNLGSVKDIDTHYLPEVDLIMAGTSCQNFSEQGGREGLKGSKSKLFYEFARIIQETQPKYALWENVTGASTHKDFEIIKQIFKDIGYEIDFEIFNAKEYSPTIQQRRRIIMLATRKDLDQVRLDRTIPSIELDEEMQSLKERLVSVSKSHRSSKSDEEGNVIEEPHIGVRLNYGIANTLVTGWACSGMSTRNYILENGVLSDLTINDCEILMTWPKDHTKYGIIDGEKIEIPLVQRYKICGNGVVSKMIPPLLSNIPKESKYDPRGCFKSILER